MLPPRAVVVHRRSELDELIDRHGTRGQAEFFLRSRDRDLAGPQASHDAWAEAMRDVSHAIPPDWRRGQVERHDLPRYLFEPEDVVIVVGQDGLVANVAKYLDGQPLVGVDPEPDRHPGVLVRHRAAQLGAVLSAVTSGQLATEARTMARARVDDGQEIVALNEIFLGHESHQSARYRLIRPVDERQSSSGVIVGTGTGATGWCASIAHDRPGAASLPAPSTASLTWFVREAWPSPTTGVSHTSGSLGARDRLEILVESESLVVFGDGLESDRLRVTAGQSVRIDVADRQLHLVHPIR